MYLLYLLWPAHPVQLKVCIPTSECIMKKIFMVDVTDDALIHPLLLAS